jgi:hypothetical protein
MHGWIMKQTTFRDRPPPPAASGVVALVRRLCACGGDGRRSSSHGFLRFFGATRARSGPRRKAQAGSTPETNAPMLAQWAGVEHRAKNCSCKHLSPDEIEEIRRTV